MCVRESKGGGREEEGGGVCERVLKRWMGVFVRE